MMRLFSKSQKQFLFTVAGGYCQMCGASLKKDWQADHITPYSKEGKTTLDNGQALCKKCNLTKSNKMSIQLRKWQETFYQKPFEFFNQNFKSYLLHAGVGSGKTIAAVMAAKEFIQNGFNVVVCSPSDNIRREWTKEFLKHGYDIDPSYTFRYNYKNDYKGISITYHSISPVYSNKDFLIRNNIIDKKTLLILDEVHHVGDNKSWGESIKEIGDMAGFVLLLTGTPTRSDNAMIPYATYEPNIDSDGTYKLKVDFSYSYANSVLDNVCCPLSFRKMDVKSELTPDGFISNSTDSRVLLSALMAGDWVTDVLKTAEEKLDELREKMPNAGGLIVCNSIKDAENLGNVLPNSVVVTSDNSDSNDLIDDFSKNDTKWIIAVNMISEGVNIPRIRVIVYATTTQTALYFYQVTGRGVRNRNDDNIGGTDHCYFYFPNCEELVKWAEQIEGEIKHIIEKQEQEFKDKIELSRERGEFNLDLIYTELGEERIMNGGVNLEEFQQYFKALEDLGMRSSFERTLAERLKGNNPAPTQLKADRVKDIKLQIHKVVNNICARTKQDPKDVHYFLNGMIGKKTTSDLHDEGLLRAKLNYAIKRLNEIINRLN